MIAPLVLSFDLDDTLWPVGPVITGAERAMFAWLRARYPQTVNGHDIDSLRAQRAQVAERFPEHGYDLTFLRHRALKDLFTAAGHAESLADDALEVFFSARNRVEFYDDVRPALERLRSRYRLFALSNGNADLQRCGSRGFVRRAHHRRSGGLRQAGCAHLRASRARGGRRRAPSAAHRR